MSRLSEGFGKDFLLTSEITLPRGPDLTRFTEEINDYGKLISRIHAVNVVDNPGSMLLMSSLSASIMLKQGGIDPIFQVTGRDRNRLAIEADLIGAAAFGIENVLALTGDPPDCPSSDHPRAKGVFDLMSVSILKAIAELNDGSDLGGGKLNRPTNFFAGAALAPGTSNPKGEIKKTAKKIEAGARFFQTQVVFDYSTVEGFLRAYEKETGEDIRHMVLVGVLPLYSHGLAKFLQKIPGIIISTEVEKRIKDARDPLEEGLNISLEVYEKVRESGFAGLHIMPAGNLQGLTGILDAV